MKHLRQYGAFMFLLIAYAILLLMVYNGVESKTIQDFRNNFIAILGILILTLLFFSYYSIQVYRVLNEKVPRKITGSALKNSYDRLKAVMDSLDALVYVADMETYEILYINKYGEDILGDVAGQTCWQTLQSGQIGPCPFCSNDRLLDPQGSPVRPLVWDLQNTVTNQWFECRDSAIHWPDGRLVRLEVATDVTGRKKAEEDRTEVAFEQLTTLVSNLYAGILSVSEENKIEIANQAFCNMFNLSDPPEKFPGLTSEEVMSKILPVYNSPAEAGARIQEIVARGIPVKGEEVALRDSCTVLRDFIPIISANGENKGRIWHHIDITENKRMERQIKASLHEKETLLREIHHRVKNNLQIISSLLSMQIRQVDNPHTLEVLRESQDRVKTMALVHEHLYQGDNLSQINIETYFRSLGTMLLKNYTSKGKNIRFEVSVPHVFLDLNTVIPLGLIVNEIITNSLKYAFKDRESGKISISASESPDTIIFVVSDDGVGIGEATLSSHETLGLRLIYGLTRQIQGTVTVDGQVGTTFTLIIPNSIRNRNDLP
ncbi:MAG: histidine kinase dimerization/phosphoacceptor domain -containing protein [Methanobacteriota archaeon]